MILLMLNYWLGIFFDYIHLWNLPIEESFLTF